MTYIPSEALATWLDGSRVGLWIDRVHGGTTALVCKMPEVAIRALHQGAGCTLLLGVVFVAGRRILCRGLRVDDDPAHPLSILCPSLSREDFDLLRGILSAGHTRLHCLNELNHPMLSATCTLELEAARDAQRELIQANPFLFEPEGDSNIELSQLDELVRQALDRFQRLTYGDGSSDGETGTMVLSSRVTMTYDEPVELFEVSPTALAGPLRVDDRDEGTKLERAAYLVLDTIYPGKTYHSPLIRIANGTREIADALALGDSCAVVIQAKALSVLSASSTRSSERRAAKLTKDVAEAIKQLQGSTRRLRSSRDLLDSEGAPISWSERETMPAHAIVLLSEMYAFLDWPEIARKVVEASESDTHRALFHVMDLMELSFIAQRAPYAGAFESVMLQRWATVQERGTAYLRARAPLP